MTLHDIHTWINFVIDKEQSGWFSPEEIDASLDRSQMYWFNQYRERYALSQNDQDSLAPFKIEHKFTNANTPGGLLSFPQNYQSFLAAYRLTLNGSKQVHRKIEIVNDDELAERLESALRPISIDDPIGQWAGRGEIQLWPKVPNVGFAHYLRRPEVPQYIYSTEGRTIVYDDINSVQLEWDDANTQRIMIKALEYLGVNLDNDKLVAYTKS